MGLSDYGDLKMDKLGLYYYENKSIIYYFFGFIFVL